MHDSTTSAPGQARDDRQDPLTRLDEVTNALVVLRDTFSGAEPLDSALWRLADTATTVIPHADGVTISIVAPGRPSTATATDQRLVRIDEAQYHARRGPCLDAARTFKPVRATAGEHSEEWPEFQVALCETNLSAYLSVPVILHAAGPSGAPRTGTLNIYSRTAAAFDPFDESLMQLFTTAASAVIANAQRRQRSLDQLQIMERAIRSRATIEQAKGVLMAVHSCSAEAAFTMLVQRSQHSNVKLRDVARALIESLRNP
ncbi:ANTAR domain-containing protein [Lentzea sp. NPDC059081]|uniref:ANTAR domain-containing protein n=1 Tax=Lentzea sp. NPDC059081 TaxID=3346719 RepID=UPI0036C1AD08